MDAFHKVLEEKRNLCAFSRKDDLLVVTKCHCLKKKLLL